MHLDHYPSIAAMIAERKPEEPVYCWHPESFREAATAFLEHFPGHTLYAVKCNPHPYVLKALYAAGIRHFDVASIGEIALIKEMFPDAHCYFMHPIKSRQALKLAFHDYGLRDFVVDHTDELGKIFDCLPAEEITVYVRVAPLATTAVYDFSKKFGAHATEALGLLREIRDHGAQAAIAFHIGSQCVTPETFTTTLELVGSIIDRADVPLVALDVGGGFPASYIGQPAPPLEEFFRHIREGVAALNLPQPPTLLCEPGRALVVNGCSLVVQVQLRKGDTLYINDSVYGSFSEVWTGKLGVPGELHRLGSTPSPHMANFAIYGCTCDSVDMLPITFSLPEDTREGDWIIVSMMGAYTNAIASHFNGFFPDDYVVIDAA